MRWIASLRSQMTLPQSVPISEIRHKPISGSNRTVACHVFARL